MYRFYLQFLLFATVYYTSALFGQSQSNIWYFGANAGLNFNSGSPENALGGQTNQIEGVSSVADSAGNLLFYSDGKTVWSKTHSVMANGTGLYGSFSSTQSALILQVPNNDSIYYIFTTNQLASDTGFCYSTVNIKMNGGLGAVVSKNTQILPGASEKLISVKHANGIDFWVIVHAGNSDEYYSYLVSNSGFNSIPVISKAGLLYSAISHTVGCLKANLCGDKLAAISVMYSNLGAYCDVLNFDSKTGVVSIDYSLSLVGLSIFDGYGVEFSPNGSVLYIGLEVSSEIYQFDLSSNDSATVLSTAFKIGTSSQMEVGALQLGPDGKIYIALYGDTTLAVIANPDSLGLACNFIDRAINIAPGECRLGLPNLQPGIFSFSPCFSVSLDSNGVTVPGTNSGWIYAKPHGGVPPYTFMWSTNETTQYISNLQTGTYTLTTTDSYSHTNISSVFIDTSMPTKIKSGFNADRDVLVYPNPANESLHVNSKNILFDEVYVTDILGQRIDIISDRMNNTLRINCSILPIGIYILHIQISGVELNRLFNVIH